MHRFVALLTETVPDEMGPFNLGPEMLTGMVIQLINAIILAVAMTFILYKPVKQFLQKRADGIQNKIDNADAAMARANELIKTYESKLEEIEKERQETLEAARAEAENERKAIIEEARVEAKQIRERAQEAIDAERRRLLEESRLYIIELSALMAKKYIAENLDEKAQDKIFEDTIAELEDAQWRT